MHEPDIRRVRESHARLTDPLAFGTRFYALLFAQRPDARRLFPPDLDAQVRKLVDMLASIVGGLDAQARLQQEFAELGRRHAGYGVSEDDYDDVGSALLVTLREFLGDAFTPEVEEAWATLYGDLAEAMIAAGDERRGS
ncbi:globin domain-containing protein [Tahibacter harae]|uniref:Globin domain-containing protein n=1 Tax=Tahibacter harae TaxID=2963937 RepID=A0ABT1QRK0_9GAMM|nr:globin domain-containing protein [Tahibacter harae]MCQ4164886.1 globin domain-containing protein [Tahibacter harae]